MSPSSATTTRDLTAALRVAGVEADGSSRARAEYSSDASLYRVVPQAVAFPRSGDDVEAALSVCRSLGVPLTPRGGGTSVAGNAVGPGLVLDFSRHMTRVLALDPAAGTAVVQPGLVLDTLQKAAAPHGLRFGPDPSTHNRCTLGGVIGNNACGNRSLATGGRRTTSTRSTWSPVPGSASSPAPRWTSWHRRASPRWPTSSATTSP